MMMKVLLAAVLFMSLNACDPPASDRPVDDCAGPDISAWKAIGPANPIVCDGKIVGYQLELDGSKDQQSFVLTTDAPPPADGLVSLSAHIDTGTGTGAERSVRMTQDGSALDIVVGRGKEILKSHALVRNGQQKVTYVVRVDVPQGVVYRGKIFDVRTSDQIV